MSFGRVARAPGRGRSESARNAVALVFALNGLAFSFLVARLPDVRSGLSLSNGQLGLLLLVLSAGSILAMVWSGRLVASHGPLRVVRLGCALSLAGLVVAALGVEASTVPLTAVGFVLYGAGSGSWDVAMNVEAAAVERSLGRSIMPRFHAAWSLGRFAGAGIGVLLTRWDVPLLVHLGGGAVIATVVAAVAAGRFLPAEVHTHEEGGGRRTVRSAWREPRTLVIGAMVLCFAVAEGAANDWLTLSLIDGYDARQWVGVAGYALFVSMMTVGRLVGPVALDRWGRVPVLTAAAVTAGGGVLLVVWGGAWPLVALGIVLWGIGAALGFPVGMSAAADDPSGAAQRVSVVATIGYGAFLAGPPLLGWFGDQVGTLQALSVVAVLMVVAIGCVGGARETSHA